MPPASPAAYNPTDGNVWASRSGQSFRANHQVGAVGRQGLRRGGVQG